MLVSILTPVYNANKGGCLEAAIESVLNQCYENIEHVIADGGSSDGTQDVVRSYQKIYPGRIVLVEEKDNGVGSGLKNAFKASSGEILGWLDADDLYEKNAIRSAVDILKDEKKHFIYGKVDIINEDGLKIGNFVTRPWDKEHFLNVQHYIVFTSVFYKRAVVEKCGYVNDLGNDLYFYLNVAKHFQPEFVDIKFSNWRLNSTGISFSNTQRDIKTRRQRAKEDFVLVLKHGGSVFSPRALTYFAVLEPQIATALRPFLGILYGPLKKISQGIKVCIAMQQRSKMGGYMIPFFREIYRAIRQR